MSQVDHKDLFGVVVACTAMDDPIFAALVVGLAGRPQDSVVFFHDVLAREGKPVRRDGELPRWVARHTTRVSNGIAPLRRLQIVEHFGGAGSVDASAADSL
jgi:hypothetical protein